jgi:hypothetical protein
MEASQRILPGSRCSRMVSGVIELSQGHLTGGRPHDLSFHQYIAVQRCNDRRLEKTVVLQQLAGNRVSNSLSAKALMMRSSMSPNTIGG